MVSRSSLSSLPPIDLARMRPDVRRTGRSLVSSLPDSRLAWKLAAWRVLFFPFWAWSDIPRPQLPERNAPLPPGGLAGEHVKSRFQSIARRTWLQRSLAILARTFVLTILFAAAWQFAELLGGPQVRFELLPYIGLALLVPALVLIACSRPSHAQTARMLDRSFHLQERMVTALANIGQDLPPGKGQAAGIRYLQVADAANALTAIRNNPAFRVMPPVRELVLGIIFALVLASLFFLRGGDGQVSPLESARVPEFIPAAQQYVAAPEAELQTSPLGEEALSEQQLQELQQESNTIRQDLMTLAGALEDHALTRPAAEAITQGDYQQAAQDLRKIAEEINGLSQSESESLASDLEQASAAMESGSEGLSGASQNAADGLREGGAAAQEGMQGVADAVEASSSQMASNESMSQAAAQEPQSSSGASAPQQSQAPGEQESLFDNQSMGQEGSASAGGDAHQSQNSEPSDQQSDASSGSDSEGDNGSGQEGGEGANEGAQSSEESGSGAQSPSEDVMAGGESLAGDPAAADPPAGSGAGQETSTGDGASEKTSGDQAAESGASGASAGEEELPDPSEPNVSEGEGGGDAEDEEVTPGGTLTLNRAPQGQSIPVQGAGSQSNLGSGGGVATAGGSSTQGSVAESGPDSNHVPPEYRSIVESYFSSGNE